MHVRSRPVERLDRMTSPHTTLTIVLLPRTVFVTRLP